MLLKQGKNRCFQRVITIFVGNTKWAEMRSKRPRRGLTLVVFILPHTDLGEVAGW
jgi:hypothetical protein